MKILTDDARAAPRPCCPGVGVGVNAGERGSDLVERLDPLDDFNFAHFRMRHMVA